MHGAIPVARVSLAALAATLALTVALSGQAIERVIYVSAFVADSYAPLDEVPSPDDIIVREDGMRREVLRVTRATEPMHIAVLVDNSAPSTPAIADLRRALAGFVEAAGNLGPIAIVSVADRPTILADYTTAPASLTAAINRLFAVPGSGTTLLDGIVETARGMGRRESERAAIVLLAAEHVEFSDVHYSRVLDVLAESGAALHAVVWRQPGGSMLDERAQNRATVLDRGIRESGGLRLDILTSQAYEGRMRELAAVLRHQYRVVYARPDTLIPPRRLEVTLATAGIDARATPARGQKGG
jgi:hypothetical protein